MRLSSVDLLLPLVLEGLELVRLDGCQLLTNCQRGCLERRESVDGATTRN